MVSCDQKVVSPKESGVHGESMGGNMGGAGVDEEELAKRGVQSLMPDEAYTNRNYEWSMAMGKQ